MVKKIQLKDVDFIKNPRYVLYYDPAKESEFSKFIENNFGVVHDTFLGSQYKLCYFPAMCSDMTFDQIKYRYPEYNGEPLQKLGNDVLKPYLPDYVSKDACFLINTDASENTYYCYKLKPLGKMLMVDQIMEFCDKVDECRWSETNVCCDEEIRFSISTHKVAEPPFWEKEFCIADEGFSMSDIDNDIKDFISKLKTIGIERFALKCMVPVEDKLSRVVITPKYDILLPDYGDMVIEMSPLPKAVFLLFLKHEDGIYFKALSDYRDELQTIYSKITNRVRGYIISNSIEQITDPTKNAINEKCSRIREAFLMKMDDAIANNYYINGNRGEVKKIDIPRNMVEWQCEI